MPTNDLQEFIDKYGNFPYDDDIRLYWENWRREMPYSIQKRGDKFVVLNLDTGHVKGTHDTREKAERQINLLRG